LRLNLKQVYLLEQLWLNRQRQPRQHKLRLCLLHLLYRLFHNQIQTLRKCMSLRHLQQAIREIWTLKLHI
jgi:hypothetical protein